MTKQGKPKFTRQRTFGGGAIFQAEGVDGFILDQRHLRGTVGGFWVHFHGDRRERDLSEKLIGIKQTIGAAKALLLRVNTGTPHTYLHYEAATHRETRCDVCNTKCPRPKDPAAAPLCGADCAERYAKGQRYL